MSELTAASPSLAIDAGQVKRKRWIYLMAAVVLIGIGLPARYTEWYPEFVVKYAGDALWAMMLILLVAGLFPRMAAWKIWLVTLIGCYLVEISQLYQADWANRIRHLPGVGLLIGYGFLWSDLVAYTVGTGAGFLLDLLLIKLFHSEPKAHNA